MSRRGAILQDYGNINHAQTMEAQHNAAQYYQRDKELAAQNQNQKDATKAKNQGDALDYIDKLKGETPIGDATVDLHNAAQLQKVKDDLVKSLASGADINQIKLQAMQELPKIAQGYTIAKTGYDKIKQGLTDVSKDLPSGNTEAARNIMGNEFLKDIFEYNSDGTVKGYKDLSLIPKDKDYTNSLMKPENLEKWYPSTTSGIKANVQGLKLIPIEGGSKRINQRGGYVKQKLSGDMSIFDEYMYDKDGDRVGKQLKAETVTLDRNPDGSLNILKVMPKEQFSILTGTPAAKAEFDLKLNKHLSEEVGINPSKLDIRAKDAYARNYALNFLEKTNLHGSSFNATDEIKEDPAPKTSVNINNRTGGDNSGVEPINAHKMLVDLMGTRTPIRTVEGGTAKIIGAYSLDATLLGALDPMITKANGGEKLNNREWYIKGEGKEMAIYKAKEAEKVSDNDIRLVYLDELGTNIAANQSLGIKYKGAAKDKASKPEDNKPKESKPDVEQGGNIFRYNTKTGQYEFYKKK